MQKSTAIAFIIVLQLTCVRAQEFLPLSSSQQATELITYVHNFDEFISHFNYKKGLLNEEVDKESGTDVSRTDLLYYLFDHLDPRSDSNNNHYNSYKRAKSNFVKHIVKKELYLSKDTNLYTQLDCDFLFNTEPVKVMLTMKYVQEEGNAYRWAISEVSAPCLALPEDENISEYLSPVSDNLNFISLQKNLGNFNFINLSDKNYQYDPLSVFHFLIETSQLKLVQVNNMQYIYYGFTEWKLTISEFNRKNYNAGWLISNLEEL